MSAELLNHAAGEMRKDRDPRWHVVADLLSGEVAVRQGLEPFVELFNVAYEKQSGVKHYLRLKRKDDGSLAMDADTSEAAAAVARAYLGEQP